MKLILACIFVLLLVTSILYTCGCILYWDINPANWHISIRLIFVSILIFYLFRIINYWLDNFNP